MPDLMSKLACVRSDFSRPSAGVGLSSASIVAIDDLGCTLFHMQPASSAARLATILGGTMALLLPLMGCGRQGLNLAVSDPDYPTLNAKSERTIRLKVTTPPTLEPTIAVSYGVTSKDAHCQTMVGEGGGFPIGLSVPLNEQPASTKMEHDYLVYPDKFAPGRCGWVFSGVSAVVKRGAVVSAGNEFVISKPYLEASSPYLLGGYLADKRPGPIWRCKTIARFQSQGPFLSCSGSQTENERPLIDPDASEIDFTLIDDDLGQWPSSPTHLADRP